MPASAYSAPDGQTENEVDVQRDAGEHASRQAARDQIDLDDGTAQSLDLASRPQPCDVREQHLLDGHADLERGVAEAFGDVIQADGPGVEHHSDEQRVQIAGAATDQERCLERPDEIPDLGKARSDAGHARFEEPAVASTTQLEPCDQDQPQSIGDRQSHHEQQERPKTCPGQERDCEQRHARSRRRDLQPGEHAEAVEQPEHRGRGRAQLEQQRGAVDDGHLHGLLAPTEPRTGDRHEGNGHHGAAGGAPGVDQNAELEETAEVLRAVAFQRIRAVFDQRLPRLDPNEPVDHARISLDQGQQPELFRPQGARRQRQSDQAQPRGDQVAA